MVSAVAKKVTVPVSASKLPIQNKRRCQLLKPTVDKSIERHGQFLAENTHILTKSVEKSAIVRGSKER